MHFACVLSKREKVLNLVYLLFDLIAPITTARGPKQAYKYLWDPTELVWKLLFSPAVTVAVASNRWSSPQDGDDSHDISNKPVGGN